MIKDEDLKLVLEGAANYIDALGGDSRKYRQALAASVQKGAIGAKYQKSPWDGKGISMPPPAAQQGLDWKAEYLKSVESGCITLDELREANAELDATNRQVEILSDALAESRREVDALVALARADEREACAQIAWNMEPDENGPIEAAIRARVNT